MEDDAQVENNVGNVGGALSLTAYHPRRFICFWANPSSNTSQRSRAERAMPRDRARAKSWAGVSARRPNGRSEIFRANGSRIQQRRFSVSRAFGNELARASRVRRGAQGEGSQKQNVPWLAVVGFWFCSVFLWVALL